MTDFVSEMIFKKCGFFDKIHMMNHKALNKVIGFI